MKYLLVLLLFLGSCSSQKDISRFAGSAMTIPYVILVGDVIDEQKSMAIETTIYRVFSEINQIYNNWNPKSEISFLNQAQAHQRIKLSSSLESFLQKVDSVVCLTEGRFDPTVRKDENHEAVGWEKIHVANGFFWKEQDLTSLDFGGVAKGYAVDLLLERLKDLGLRSLWVEWGGEIKTCGTHPQKRPWKVSIFGLDVQLTLQNSAIATSGNYLQNWQKDGKTFTHIIDPFTKKPLEVTSTSINSVSVLAETCLEADALATALMVFSSKESAQEWAQKHGIKIWIY